MSRFRIDLRPEYDQTNGGAAHLPPRTRRAHLTGDIRADWIVIGAGWAGLAAARPRGLRRRSEAARS